MSFDLQVWSVYAATRITLRQNLQWNEAPSGWVHAARDWQIVVSHSGRVMEEDIPNAVKSLLPGIEHRTEINVEGRFAEAAKQIAIATGTSLARICYGVLVDPQEGTQWTPSGVSRLKATKSSSPPFALYLSWWFMEGPLLSRSGRQEFLEVLRTELPEALPKRYGPWEPPQHVFAQTGREHLLEFLGERLPSGLPIVWYPHRPVIYLHLGLPKTAGGSPKGFRSNYLQVEIDNEALNQPGWETQLRRFWLSMNRLIHPFYSEARTLPRGIEKHPCSRLVVAWHPDATRTRSGAWRGISATMARLRRGRMHGARLGLRVRRKLGKGRHIDGERRPSAILHQRKTLCLARRNAPNQCPSEHAGQLSATVAVRTTVQAGASVGTRRLVTTAY